MNRAPSSRIQAASKRANERVSKSGQRSKQVAPAVCTPLAGSPLVCVSLSLLLPPSSACKHTNLRMPVLCTVVHRSRASVVLPFTKNKEMWRWWWGGGERGVSHMCRANPEDTDTHTQTPTHHAQKDTQGKQRVLESACSRCSQRAMPLPTGQAHLCLHVWHRLCRKEDVEGVQFAGGAQVHCSAAVVVVSRIDVRVKVLIKEHNLQHTDVPTASSKHQRRLPLLWDPNKKKKKEKKKPDRKMNPKGRLREREREREREG